MAFKLWLEPKITPICTPQFTEPEHLAVEWPQAEPASDGERLIEYAGRVCYMSYHNPAHRTTEEYIGNILKQGHGSVLEHANYSFLLEGISRSCSHELVRHRAGWAYSQVSQRFVDSSNTSFVVPPALKEWSISHPEILHEFERYCVNCLGNYQKLVDSLMQEPEFLSVLAGESDHMKRKRAREAARCVLPNATETKMVVTGNLRAWRTMLELRAGEGADLEIRRLAIQLLHWFKTNVPSVFEDFIIDSSHAHPHYHKV